MRGETRVKPSGGLSRLLRALSTFSIAPTVCLGVSHAASEGAFDQGRGAVSAPDQAKRTRAASASSATADSICPRSQVDSMVSAPPELESQYGLLVFAGHLLTVVDAQLLTRYCLLTSTGLEAPALRPNPVDQPILHQDPQGLSQGQVPGGDPGSDPGANPGANPGALIVESLENVDPGLAGLTARTFPLRAQLLPNSEWNDSLLAARDLSIHSVPLPDPGFTPAVIQANPAHQEPGRAANTATDAILNLQPIVDGTAEALEAVAIDGYQVASAGSRSAGYQASGSNPIAIHAKNEPMQLNSEIRGNVC